MNELYMTPKEILSSFEFPHSDINSSPSSVFHKIDINLPEAVVREVYACDKLQMGIGCHGREILDVGLINWQNEIFSEKICLGANAIYNGIN